MKRGAAIYLGEDRIVIEPHDRSSYGGYLAGYPVRTLIHAASVAEILNSLEQSLTDTKIVVGIISDAKALVKPLLAATGEKTWHAVSRSFAYVGVEEDSEEIVFFAGFPEKGSFLFRSEAHWRCDRKNITNMTAAFRSAAAVAIEAQNLANPPLLP